jgi:hypothetical protein
MAIPRGRPSKIKLPREALINLYAICPISKGEYTKTKPRVAALILTCRLLRQAGRI